MKQWKKVTALLLIIFLMGSTFTRTASASAEDDAPAGTLEDLDGDGESTEKDAAGDASEDADNGVESGGTNTEEGAAEDSDIDDEAGVINTEEELLEKGIIDDEAAENDMESAILEVLDSADASDSASLQRISKRFPDPALAKHIANQLGAGVDDIIAGELERRLLEMTDLSCYNAGVKSLKGIQCLANLETLTVSGNEISDISPVQGLTKLEYLDISSNNISNIKPLENLSNLATINLKWNQIVDLSVLGTGHPKLEKVEAYGQVHTYETIDLNGADFFETANIVRGLNDTLLEPTSDPGIKYDAQTGMITFLNIRSAEGTLAYSININTDILEFTLSVVRPYRNGNSASFQGVFPARLREIFESESLAENIAHELALGGIWTWQQRDNWSSAAVTEAQLEQIRSITQNRYVGMESTGPIYSLEGIQYCKNMVVFELDYELENNLTDLSPLCNLQKLTTLMLENCGITDISPLSNLKNLSTLYLRQNSISDISPLRNLENLKLVWLRQNNISDISPLQNLENLSYRIDDQELSIETTWNPSDASIQMILPLTGLDGTGSDIEVTSIKPTGTYYADKQLLHITNVTLDSKSGFTFATPTSEENRSEFSGTVSLTITGDSTVRRLTSTEGLIIEGAIPEGAEFITRKVPSGTEYDLLKKHMGSLHTESVVYQMYLEKDGEIIQPGSIVKISVPASQNQEHAGAYRLESDGTITGLTATVSGEYISFETEHFSYYGVGTGEIAKTPAETSASKKSDTSNPQTGDSAQLFIFLLMLFSAGGVLGIYKKRNGSLS